ncbi:response regulator transcription factor [Brachybacterium nesterenkovii]|uniref:Putative two-component system response regulator n=1 Tax=Brachybacterium nesterenkovii TaxID=47847 RepID=A0A1X6WV35_9MICO|nr:response regulator transcription factor [Brachybacterium nesterenkovii]SLM88123.1 putative two-component system response regulator [Brachybacterium nesterenkovii]
MTAHPIRVALADDQAILRRGLAALLGLEHDIEVVAEAETCAGTVAAVAEHRPDVLLLDVQMPAGSDAPGTPADGLEVASALAGMGVRIIVLTTFGRAGYLRRTLETGASGFMVKDAPVEQLVDAIRRVHQGLRVVDPELAAQSLASGPNPLTAKEAEVLRAASRGGSTADIAARVFLSEGTVRNHVSSAIGKLGVTNRAEAVRAATDAGWL